ncbi:MAG: class GN sortase [Candidatus Rokubacteria bacterium]|nr:class GN sortase [Candidatus Rokubacteria bacterium]
MLVLLIVISALPAPVAWATGQGGDAGLGPRRVTEGTLLWRTAQQETPMPAPVLRTDVEMRVTGMVLRATVRQEFANPSGEWAEGVYVFPLPEEAAVDHLRMRVGARIIEGVVQERAAAKAAYEQAKQEGKRASLVEQERPNIFTTSVANIPPGAAIEVEIEYQQAVRYDAGRFRLRFPMVVGPRYIPGAPAATMSGSSWAPDTDAVPDASRITPPVQHPSRGWINPVSLRIELDPGVGLAGLESPYHEIHTLPLSAGRYEITLEQVSVPADRDFELVWQPVAGAAPEAALLTSPQGDEVFALLMVLPPGPTALERLPVPREVIFVLDNSGSMSGASIEQAKAALRLALARLRSADTFNVVRFNHRTDSLILGAQPASPQNVQAAERYVGSIRAEGGTEMLPALLRRTRRTGAAGPAAADDLPDRRRYRQRGATLPGDPRAPRRQPPVHPRHRLGAQQLWQVGQGAWIYAKARLAQHLLHRAWARTLGGESEAKPWPWADTWPVARLRVPAHGVDLIVLAGVSGRVLASGPGHALGSAVPGAPGTAIVTGHRDTHFRFLERVKPGDEIVVEAPGRPRSRFRVRELTVVDSRTAVILRGEDTASLVLLTCYPFDAVRPGGPLRYVVAADAAGG